MTRPQMIRADTIDLQDQHSPSAQDHTRQPEHPAPLGIGSAAPHQAAAVRHVNQERTAEERILNDAWSDATTLHDEPPSDDEHTLNESADERNMQRDELAVRQNGGMSGSDDADLADAEVDDSLDDDNMDRISSSPSIDDEDIDFDFVYALHTFQAVVEGQANAAKGDTMVLLDDSNSYWWLVRIVKDGSIGYLPAEHIETPTERLARLNKHRNIDLSAAMLGDTAEKSKNPLKKAMRRRNAKTVTFTAPTYVEASDYDYSSDEEEGEDVPMADAEPQAEQQAAKVEEPEQQDDTMAVEPLKVNGAKKDKKDSKKDKELKKDAKKDSKKDKRDKANGDEEKAEVRDSDDKKRNKSDSSEQQRTSDEMFEQPLNPKVSKNGTVRNTDSFFKDETTETRKITLTPMLIRDDNQSSAARTSESTERGGSFDILDRSDKSKDDKKRKDKKPGMLSGLFKRKDKKTKGMPDGVESSDEKRSEENSRASPQPKMSEDYEKSEGDMVQRTPSKGKLQKTQLAKKRMPEESATPSPEPIQQQASTPAKSAHGPSTMRMVSSSPERETENTGKSLATERSIGEQGLDKPQANRALESERPKPTVDTGKSTNPFMNPSESRSQNVPQNVEDDPLSESPIHVSPVDEPDPSRPPGLIGDNSSQEDRSISPVSPSSSPSLIDIPMDGPSAPTITTGPYQYKPQQPSPVGPPPSRPPPNPVELQRAQEKARSTPSPIAAPAPVWSDASLRSYFEDGTDVRDLLLVVHDKSGVVPVTDSHPIMAGLFEEEKGRLGAMGRALDGLLVDWLERRRRLN